LSARAGGNENLCRNACNDVFYYIAALEMAMKKGIINILGIFLLIFAGYAFFIQQPPYCYNLYPDMESDNTYPGVVVKWVAMAEDPNGDVPMYKFSVRSSDDGIQDSSDWSYDNTWIWYTDPEVTDSFTVTVQVRDCHHAGPDDYDDKYSSDYNIRNEAPYIEDLTISPYGYQEAGGIVDIEASAGDREGGYISYEFMHNGPNTDGWESLGESGSSNRITWQTGEEDIGANYIKVIVRDKFNQEGNESLEEYIEITDPLPRILGLVSDQYSPQTEGTEVIWTADAEDKYDDHILYKFWLSGPRTNYEWQEVRGWSEDSQYLWETSSSDVGESEIKVWIRDENHAGTDGFDDSDSNSFIIESLPVYYASLNENQTAETYYNPITYPIFSASQ
jgi:hypothetical protein